MQRDKFFNSFGNPFQRAKVGLETHLRCLSPHMDLKLFLRIRFGDEKTGKGFNSLFSNASLRGHLDNTKKTGI